MNATIEAACLSYSTYIMQRYSLTEVEQEIKEAEAAFVPGAAVKIIKS